MTDPHAWHSAIVGDLWHLHGALIHVVDVPDEDVRPPRLLDPTDRKDVAAQRLRRDATKGADRDADYARPPSFKVRTAERSDPTGRAAQLWADRIVNVCTHLAGLTDDFDKAATISLAQFGRVHPAPPVYTSSKTAGGRDVVNVGPSTAARFIAEHVRWQIETAGALADWWVERPDGADEMLDVRCQQLLRRVRHQLHRHRQARSRDVGPSRCLNPHGLTNHPLGLYGRAGVCAKCLSPQCPDPLGRGCDRRLTVSDADAGRSACGACRKAKSRREHA